MLQDGRPVVLALPCCQPPAGRGIAGWSAPCVYSTMPSTTCWQGRYHAVGRPLQMHCGSVGTECPLESIGTGCSLGLVGISVLPVDLTEARSDMHLTWRLCDVAKQPKLGSLEYIAGELIDRGTMGLLQLDFILRSLRADDGLDERLGMIWLVAAEERSSRVTGLIAAEICNSGPAGLMVAEIRNSGTAEPMVVKIHVSGTIELKVAKIHVSGAVGLTMAKTHVLGTTELMMAETHIPGTAGLTVVEIHVSNTTELMVAEIHISVGLIVAEVCSSGVAELRVVEIRNLGTIGLMVAEMRFCIARMYGSSASALRAPHARILREPTRADVANSRNESVLIDIVGSLGCVLSLPRVCEPLPGGL
ncbi:hypothetical protein BHE74_00049889 [Ensete ventricosum]|nr:hypothetical protein BHE74_00049889 [Ensete ventricosum]